MTVYKKWFPKRIFRYGRKYDLFARGVAVRASANLKDSISVRADVNIKTLKWITPEFFAT